MIHPPQPVPRAEAEAVRSRLEERLLEVCEPVGNGLRVWAVDRGDSLEIRGVVVEPEARGGWAFVRWIRSLPRDRTVIAVQVSNERLAQVFERSGFRLAYRFDADEQRWLRSTFASRTIHW